MQPAVPSRIEPVAVTAHGLVCAAGVGRSALAQALRVRRSALTPNDFSSVALSTWIGRVAGLESQPLPASLRAWDCRATRLAWLGLQADDFIAAAQRARERFGADRVGLVLGTSASTIGVSEHAYSNLDAEGRYPPQLRCERLHSMHAVTAFVREVLALRGPCATVSVACASSAKAWAQGERWLRLRLADAVVVAGVDALCDSVLFGFQSLGLLSPEPCRPFAADRRGISVAEAAGYALLERGPGALQLLGCGESNDAHHMSSPHPQGLGAERALDAALARAGLAADQIDSLSLHGTASARNDEVEAALVARRYPPRLHADAGKAITGHAMGAAGMVQAAACLQALHDGRSVGGGGVGVGADPALGPVFAAQFEQPPGDLPVRRAASHSFGFGGNNCVLIFGRG